MGLRKYAGQMFDSKKRNTILKEINKIYGITNFGSNHVRAWFEPRQSWFLIKKKLN